MICTTLQSLIYGGRNNPAGTEVDIEDERQARRLIAKGILAEGIVMETAPAEPASDAEEVAESGAPLGEVNVTDAPADSLSTTDEDPPEPNPTTKRGRRKS